jgi:hypothetical protein
MKLLFFAFSLAICASAQTLSVTLTKTDGTTTTRTLTGAPVTAGVEVLELFRAASCTTRSADGGCAVLKYPDTPSAILGVLIDKIVELSDTYPTSATASARARKAQAEAEIAATKTALANAAKPQ